MLYIPIVVAIGAYLINTFLWDESNTSSLGSVLPTPSGKMESIEQIQERIRSFHL
jgi:hypothetical protein